MDYSLAAVMNQLPLPLPFCSIRIQYSGPPGSVEAEVSSVENTSRMVVDARVGFVVTANGVRYYLTKLKLQPHETRAIDIRALRDTQESDPKKSKIPAAATDGGVMWIRLNNVPVMGRLMVISRRVGMTSSYDCCVCQCPASFDSWSFQLDPASFSFLPGQAMQCECYAYYSDCNNN